MKYSKFRTFLFVQAIVLACIGVGGLCVADESEQNTVVERPAFQYDAELKYKEPPEAYKHRSTKPGKVEKVTYQTSVYEKNFEKTAYVYLPYDYDQNDASKKYNVFYLMHGGGENERTILFDLKAMKHIFDHMVENGEIEPTIVVTPTINNGSGSNLTTTSKEFWNELVKDVVPAVESRYNVFAESVSEEDLKASRDHRAFGGFSMGALTTWYVLINDLDYFKYFMPLSGDCWSSNTPSGKAATIVDAIKKSGYSSDEYKILCASGTKDIAYKPMSEQIAEMVKATDVFTVTSDFSQGNFYFLVCDGGVHWWDGFIVNYVYDALPYLFRE